MGASSQMSLFKRRMKVLEALARASEATAEATRLILEDELDPDSVPPIAPSRLFPSEPEPSKAKPIVVPAPHTSSSKDLSPQTYATAKVPRHTSYTFTHERSRAHVRKAFDAAKTKAERDAVIEMAVRLESQGLLSSEDVEALREQI